ncbi:MAG: hypothetical protein M3Y32_11915, partial [Pseudomonadota bacterium]|nr:hypothetical protein [Pseudomonadota bacterium]
MKRRSFLAGSAATSAGFAFSRSAFAGSAYKPSAVIGWNQAATAAIAATASGPTVGARALSMVHEAIYNAWACYEPRAAYTLGGLVRRPSKEQTTSRKTVAVSHAAYGVLIDLFPAQNPIFGVALQQA